MKAHLFYAILAIFVATAGTTLLGLLKVVEMDATLLKMLVTGLLLEIAVAVIGLFKKTPFFGEPEGTAQEPQRKDSVPQEAESIVSLGAPQAGKYGILVDQSHKQAKWRDSTILNFDKEHRLIPWIIPPPAIASWELKAISNSRQLTLDQMKPWRGLILAMPFHAWLKEAERQEIIKWVQAGGRLALLGFELGERHHETNFNQLANVFGLRFNSDMVAPKGWAAKEKPYDAPVVFSEMKSTHSILQGVSRLSLKNACTLTVEPGGRPILSVGDHGISQVQPDGVIYTDGWLKGGSYRFSIVEGASWIPIIAEAPSGLTGQGRVLAIGTWDLLADFRREEDNAAFLRNLFDWLAALP
jgi:hypothetical protein